MIALVISIIVMLILAGVSISAIVGEDGIITKAQGATYTQSRVALEEYLNQYYVEHYDEFEDFDNKAVALKSYGKSSSWFYQGAPLGYVVDSDGNSHYFINVDGLPDELKSSIKGGKANGKETLTYQDYAKMEDVYGITSDLKVYYCSTGKDSISGVTLDVADTTKEVFAAGSNMAKLITGSNDNSVTLEDLKTVKTLTINSSSGITSLRDLYALSSLNELTINGLTLESLDGIENAVNLIGLNIQNCNIQNYSALGKIGSKLNHLYLYQIDDNELNKLCSKSIGIGSANLSQLKYFSIVGSWSKICSTDTSWNIYTDYTGKGITTLEPLENLTTETKNAINYLSLQTNYLTNLSALNEFKNLILLRAENNFITDISGISNMNNLAYLYLCNNKISNILDLQNNVNLKVLMISYNNNLRNLSGLNKCKKLYYLEVANCDLGNGEQNIKTENDALYSIKDLSLKYLDVQNNSNLIHIAYGYNKLESFFLSGCTSLSTSDVSEIKNRYNSLIPKNKNIEEKYIRYLNSDERIDYYQYSNTGLNNNSDEIMYLYNNKDVKYLRLDYNTDLTDNVAIGEMSINEILSTCSNLIVLSLRGIDINSIDFVTNMPNLKELDLWDCNITDLTPLENTDIVLSALRINNSSVVLSNIPRTLSSLEAEGNSHTFMFQSGGSYEGGLYATKAVYEKVGTCKDLTNISWCNHLDTGAYMDLSNTKLINIELRYPGLKVKLPSTCETAIFTWKAVNYVPDLSLASNLQTVVIGEPTRIPASMNQTIWTDWFNELSKCPNLTGLTLCTVASANKVNGIEKLSNCKKLCDLVIQKYDYATNREATDFTGIGEITSLKKLTLRGYKITSLNEFSTLINLVSLDVADNLISSTHGLENLKKLVTLQLQANCIYDTTTININGEKVTYNNLEILANLNKNGSLRQLYLSGNPGIIDWTPVSSITNWTDKSGW